MTTEQTKQRAEELVEKHLNYTSGWTSTNKPLEPATARYEGVKMKLGRAVLCAIISVENTIEVLEELEECTYSESEKIKYRIADQQQILEELKSRL